MVLLDVLTIRLQGLNKSLEWDAGNMRITKLSPDEELKSTHNRRFAGN